MLTVSERENTDETSSPHNNSEYRTLDGFFDLMPVGCYQMWLVFILGVANSSDATEILAMGYINSETNWNDGLLSASVFAGMLLGGLFAGILSDRIGRRPTLLLGLGVNAVAGVISALMPTPGTLSIVRFVAGVGIGGTVPAIFTLAAELMPQRKRGFFMTIVAWFWMVGSLFTALLAYITMDVLGASWRVFILICAFPSTAAGLLVLCFLPESPRFYALNGRFAEALSVSNRIARKSGFIGAPLEIQEVEYQYSWVIRSRESRSQSISSPRSRTRSGATLTRLSDSETGSAGTNSCAAKLCRTFDHTKSVLSKLYGPETRKTALVLQIIWFSLSFGSYGLITWITTLFKTIGVTAENGDPYVNSLIFAAASLPGNVLSTLLIERIGRRAVIITAMVVAAISVLLFAGAVSNPTSFSGGIVVSACFFQASSVAGWNAIDVLSAEAFPTSIRSSGMGILSASGRIGAMIAQFVNSALVKNPPILLLVTGAMLCVGAISSCMMGQDMTNRALSDQATENGAPHPLSRAAADSDSDDRQALISSSA